MARLRFVLRTVSAASFFLTSSFALTGCSSAFVSAPAAATPSVAVTGNWQLNSSAAGAAKLAAISGSLSGSSAQATGIFHADAANACVKPSESFAVSGSANAENVLTLTGTGVAGGTITIKGTLAADGKSLSDASYTVSGGTCAFAAPADATAQQYAAVSGTYTGTFVDQDGLTIPLTATLSQSPASDTDGNFTLTGSGNFGQNPCFVSPVSNVSSMVTGGTFNMTYQDQTTANTVNLTGTFSTDGKTLTVSQWTLTGSCGPDGGTGSLVENQ